MCRWTRRWEELAAQAAIEHAAQTQAWNDACAARRNKCSWSSSRRSLAQPPAPVQQMQQQRAPARQMPPTTLSQPAPAPLPPTQFDDGEVLEKAGVMPPSYKESVQVNRAEMPAEPAVPMLRKKPSLGATSFSASSSSGLSSSSSGSLKASLDNLSLADHADDARSAAAAATAAAAEPSDKYERKLAKLQRKMAQVTEKMERRREERVQRDAVRATRRGHCCC